MNGAPGGASSTSVTLPGVSRAAPDDLVGTLIPDLELPSSDGGTFRLRSRIGAGPLVLFFYLRNATPG
jgi:hypothetical protein